MRIDIGTTPHCFAPNWARASRKNEQVGHYHTQRVAPKVKASCQPVTSEVMSITQRSRVGFWHITSSKVVIKPKCEHHRNPLIKPRQRICFLFGKGQSHGWPRGQCQVTHTKITYRARGSSCTSVDSGAQCKQSGVFVDSIWIWSEVIDEKHWWPKRTPVTSSKTSHKINKMLK